MQTERGRNTGSGMAAKSTASNVGAHTGGEGFDYARLGEAVADAMESRGLGSFTLDGHTFGGALEPSVSQATRRRSGQSVTGRASRMVLA